MNTAMADGAAQRLVAQIGEALFGQPGLTLMELAEKVKQHDLSLDHTIGERDRYHEVADELAGHIAAITGVDIGEHSSANCPWQNAIEAAEEYQPAQPSLAGQGDYVQGSDELRGRSEGERAAYREGLEEGKKVAARQPVAQQPAYNAAGISLTACQLHEALLMAGDPELDVPFEDRSLVRIFSTETGHSGPGLYCECVDAEEEGCILLDGTAPAIRQAAQAVDLGAMPDGWRLSKKSTCYQLSHGNDIVGNLIGPDAEENAAIIARVLDSKAVGDG